MGYFVVVRKAEGSDYGVEVPDLPGCFSAGSTLDEAREMISEAMRVHIDSLLDDKEVVPVPSDIAEIERVLTPDHRGSDFFALLEVEPVRQAPKSVRVNVTFDENLLSQMDEHTRREGLTRSGFLADAVRSFLTSRTARG